MTKTAVGRAASGKATSGTLNQIEGIGVADMAVQSGAVDVAGPYDRAKALSAFKAGDVTFYWITRVCAISVLLILGGIILSLIVGAWPAMKEYGFAFLWTQRWAPSADPPVLGALGPMYGTFVTSFIAMLIAIPVGLGIAIFLTELCPQLLRRPIGIAIELLAGIPSIIYGIWGLFVFAPFLQSLPDDVSSATAGIESVATAYLPPSLLSALAYAWSGVAAAFTWIGGLPLISTLIFYI